jgi:hypothetical protein
MIHTSVHGHVDLQPVAYADRAGSVGRISLYVCETCGALVSMDYVHRHDQWHEKLRRAVDEVELLG